MGQSDGRIVAVTGANGFLGRAVIDRIRAGALGPIADLRLNDLSMPESVGASVIAGDISDPAVQRRLIGDGVDLFLHLASMPGGAAEQDRTRGRAINLDASIALLDALSTAPCPIVVFASSIAALGRPSEPVTEATALRPTGSYGAHKAMVELYLADLSRQGGIDGRAIRLAGIVARRSGSYAGFATAWMSDVFHAALAGRAITVPASAGQHIWLQSVDIAADNIIHAARMPSPTGHSPRAWTLPASVVRVGALVDALSRLSGTPMTVSYDDRAMGNPPLDASTAKALGFRDDGDLDALIERVIRRIQAA